MFGKTFVFFIVIMMTGLTGCTKSGDSIADEAATTQSRLKSEFKEKTQYSKEDCPVYKYGPGIYYFDCSGREFAQSLAIFKAATPDIIVTAISGDVSRQYGYIVVTELRDTR